MSFKNLVYDDGTVRYRVGSLASSFQAVVVGDNDLAWHSRALGTISINSTCRGYEDVPPTALLNHLLFGTASRTFLLEETTTVDGRGALHVVVDVELDGVPVRLNAYLVQKDGCVYDLVHVIAPADFEGARPVFEAFVRAFAVLSTQLTVTR